MIYRLGLVVAAVPSGLSLTPLQESKKETNARPAGEVLL
jgi:hypothetical protein